MASCVARAILWIIFAFIFWGTIKKINTLFELSLSPHVAIVPAVLIYVFQELMIKKATLDQKAPRPNSPASGTEKILYLVTWIIVGSLFGCILIVWALLVYHQIITNR